MGAHRLVGNVYVCVCPRPAPVRNNKLNALSLVIAAWASCASAWCIASNCFLRRRGGRPRGGPPHATGVGPSKDPIALPRSRQHASAMKMPKRSDHPIGSVIGCKQLAAFH